MTLLHHSAIRNPQSAIRPRRGFTLVEVLATVAMIAIVLPVAMYGIQLCLQTASNAKHQAEAATLAQNKLQELTALASLPQTSSLNESGDFAPDFPDYKWQSNTTDIDTDLQQLDVRVTWLARNQQRDLTLSTWVYRAPSVQ
jgi:prepilin-type N-terminal cleavage/methylation domain-containing protein